MQRLLLFLTFAGCLFLTGAVTAQRQERCVSVALPGAESHALRLQKALKASPSAEAATRLLETEALHQRAQGFAAFIWDTVALDSPCWRVVARRGPYFQLLAVQTDSFPDNKPLLLPGPYAPQQVEASLKKSLQSFQNQGYPFASFHKRDEIWETGTDTVGIRLVYTFRPGPLVTFDSVEVTGNLRERGEFVRNLVHLDRGTPYNQKAIDDIPKVLNNTPYYQQVKPARVVFLKSGNARLSIEVQRRRSNRFDLLLGLLPASDPNAQDQRPQITGNADVLLVSAFRNGEIIQAKYTKLPTAQSQQTYFRFVQPYLWGIPLRVEGELDLLRQDTTFVNRKLSAGVGYVPTPFLVVRAGYRFRRSDLLSTNRFRTDTADRANYLDGTRRMYLTGFTYENTDYKPNPRTGMNLLLELSGGTYEVRRNVDTLAFPERVYANLPEKQRIAEGFVQGEGFIPFGKRGVVRVSGQGYALFQQAITRAEQRQTGGARSLRGFNENQFMADRFGIVSAEARLLLDRDSHALVFADWGYLEDHAGGKLTVRRPLGVGAGMAYATRAGVISVQYAIGRDADTPFMPGRGKIHVGLVQVF